jgi:hypothetical protein
MTIDKQDQSFIETPADDDDDEAYEAAMAEEAPAPDAALGVRKEMFVCNMRNQAYFFLPAMQTWSKESVNSRLPKVEWTGKNGELVEVNAASWIGARATVEDVTWAPGYGRFIYNKLLSGGGGGWIDHRGVRCLNTYRPPSVAAGDAAKARPWVDHVELIYPDEAAHIVSWLAHRVQRPQEKINHCLVLGGAQGIGKDSLLEPAKYAIGGWNFEDVSPTQLMGRFNGFLKSVILRVSETRDLGDVDRYGFYEAMKTYTAAPPDVLRIDEKFMQETYVVNVVGIVMTTNNKAGGIYLPADDRRHFVAWSNLTKDDFTEGYWNGLYRWYESGGLGDVAAYLAEHDLSAFNPKAPPAKTPAWHDIVSSSAAPECAELADLIDKMRGPDALTLGDLRKECPAHATPIFSQQAF